MDDRTVVRLGEEELDLVKPLLVELFVDEQAHYSDHPQLSRAEVEGNLPRPQSRFDGENVFYAIRAGRDRLAGFCWCVLFDPGTGLEGEVAEVYVAADQRGRGIGEALMARAVELFRERSVTLGYVWTRHENEAAVRLYQSAGFEPTRQLVMTWYPV